MTDPEQPVPVHVSRSQVKRLAATIPAHVLAAAALEAYGGSLLKMSDALGIVFIAEGVGVRIVYGDGTPTELDPG